MQYKESKTHLVSYVPLHKHTRLWRELGSLCCGTAVGVSALHGADSSTWYCLSLVSR